MGGCQNYGPVLGTLNIRGRIIIGTQKGTICQNFLRLRKPNSKLSGGRIALLILTWELGKGVEGL